MKNIYKIACILSLSLLFSNNLYSYNFRQISSKEGLSCSSVYSIWQDEQRFMWFGSFDGLNMYNGRNIVVYKPDISSQKSLSGNIIRNIIGTDENYLWISTKTALNKFSLKTKSVEKYFREFNESAHFAKDKQGNLYIVGKQGKLSAYQKNIDNFIDLPIAENIACKYVSGFVVDSQDTIRILYRGFLQNYTVTNIDSDKPKIERHENYQHSCLINYLFYSEGKVLFVDEKGGLYEISSLGTVFITDISQLLRENGAISSLIVDNTDILVAFNTNGLVCLQSSNKYKAERININCGVFALWKDKEQNILWIATDGQGVYAWIKDSYSFNSLNLSQLPFKKYQPVRAIYTDSHNNLWIGTKGNGVIKLDDYSEMRDFTKADITHFSAANGLSNNEVFVFEPSRKNNILWIGSAGNSLNYFSYNDNHIHTLANNTNIHPISVHALLEQNDSLLWIGAGYTLMKFIIGGDKNNLEVLRSKPIIFASEQQQQTYNQIYSIYAESDSILWVGMRGNGLIRYNTLTENYHTFSFNDNDIGPVNDILCIYRDYDETLWLGSNYGLIKFTYYPDGKYVYRNYNENDGLPNNMIHGILGNYDKKLWLSSNSGIILFDPIKESFRSFNRKTGLDIIEYSDNAYYKDTTQETYFFGGVDGLTWIKRENVEQNKFTPEIYFTNLRIFNKDYNISDFEKIRKGKPCIELNYKQNFFAISFVAVDFVNGENSRYQYKLENFSNEWIDTRQNEAQFTNIPPGKYRLYVKYDDVTGNTENLHQSIEIVILPPWYLSICAKIAYFLLAIALIYGIYYFIKLKYKQRKERIQHELQEKYKEEMYESKLRFFTNITHEISTPLTLIYGPCDRILQYEGSDSFIKKYAQMIKSNVERLNNLIQEIIDFRRIETGNKIRNIKTLNISEITKEISDSFVELAERNNISFETGIAPDMMWNSDKSCFTKILNNLISNAFKYTPENGKIRVECCMVEKELTPFLHIVVHNTGKGISEEDIPIIFSRYSVLDNIKENSIKGLSSRNGLGLAICQSMTALLEGDITVNSKVNEYTEFVVSLPMLEITASEQQINEMETVENNDTLNLNKANNVKHGKQPKEKILVIDDNSELLVLVSDILQEKYQVITATDGKQGLEILKKETPDVIVTDIMMPEIDGITLTRQIKGNKHTMHIPLVIMSAKNTTDDKIQGVESGADVYIPKPFDAGYLLSIVHRLIENKKSLEEYYNSSASAFEFTGGQLLQKEDKEFLRQAAQIIDQNINNNEFSPEMLAETMRVSVRALYRRLKDVNQLPPNEFIKERRIQHAAKLLLTTNLTIQEIMYQTGFINRSHFYKEFTKRYEKSPKEYRRDNRQQDKSL